MTITLAQILKNNFESELTIGEKFMMCNEKGEYMVFENTRNWNGFDKSSEKIDEIFDNPFYVGLNLQDALAELLKPFDEDETSQ